MTKYYRVKEDTFMYSAGAVLQSTGSGYTLVDDIYEAVPIEGEYISDKIIEHKDNAKYFERVYKVNLIASTVYKLKSEAKEILSEGYKAK